MTKWFFGIAFLVFLCYVGGNYAPGFFQFSQFGLPVAPAISQPAPLPNGFVEAADARRSRFVVECESGQFFETIQTCLVFDKKTRIEYVVAIHSDSITLLDKWTEEDR